MKKLVIAIALVASLAACKHKETTTPAPDGEVIEDNECPRADGQPCR